MFKYLIILVVFPLQVLAFESPQLVIDDWQKCQMNSSQSHHCLQTRSEIIELHEIIEALQQNPQQVGLNIMTLQNKITQLESKGDIEKIKETHAHLDNILKTVGWLESPK